MLNELFITLSLIQQSSDIPLEPCQLNEAGGVIEESLELEAAEIPTDGYLRAAFTVSEFAEDGSKLNFTPVVTRLSQLALDQIVELESFGVEVDLESNLQFRYIDVYQDTAFNACENEGTCWIIQETETEEGSAFFCRALRMPAAGIAALPIRSNLFQRSGDACEPDDEDCQSIRIGNAADQGVTPTPESNLVAARADGLGCSMGSNASASPLVFMIMFLSLGLMFLWRRIYSNSTAGKI